MRHRFTLALLLLLFPLLAARHNTPPPTRPGGKDYALFFAVEQYDNGGAWKTLPGLIGECEDIRTDLVDRFGFSTESKVVKNPTLKEIQDELARWRSKTYGPDDQLLVFFSGHGQFDDDLGEGFFIPRDGRPSSTDVSERKWYSLLQLPRHVTKINCRHILLAIDACFSGTIDSRVALKNEDEEWAEPSTNADERFNQYVHDRLAAKSRILMTSGGKNRTKHPSDFVKWFREGLATLGGQDRIVRPGDIEERWPASTTGRPLAGTFEGHEPGGNFLFVYQSKAPPPDYDSDGVPDNADQCPTEPGLASTKGCPDSDRDGVADKFDRCKDQAGLASNDGCPLSPEPAQPSTATSSPQPIPSTANGYAIQLLARPGDIPVQQLEIFRDLTAYGNLYLKDEGPMHKLRLGVFTTKPAANEVLKKVKPYNKDAFVVEEIDADASLFIQMTIKSVEPSAQPDFADPMAASMVYLEGGTFQMGSNDGKDDEKPVHAVELSPFWISKYEVTIGQYLAFCEATNSHWPEWLEVGSEYHFQTGSNKDYYPSRGMSRSNTNHAVTGVSWNDAVAYCNWLKEKTGLNYRLPTEAEWEYAARGGQKSKGYTYAGSNTLNNVAWNINNSGSKVHPVGGLQANEAGLYDLSGNVWEWCADWFSDNYYAGSSRKNPFGPSTGSSRVVRSSAWICNNLYCRLAYRSNSMEPSERDGDLGFRVAQGK